MSVVDWFRNRIAIAATMHQKEQAIASILEPALELQIQVPDQFNTDSFGTFTREIKRPGDQLETARLKALKALEITGADLAIASEGSFAPHPAFPMLACDREIIFLIDTANDLEIVGEIISTQTNFNHKTISSFEQAKEFAEKIGFPDHGLIVATDPEAKEMIKGICDLDRLRQAVETTLARSTTGKIHLETDMRAMHNPMRMNAIAQATQDLLSKIQNQCSNCGTPGFQLTERQRGLPCGWCGAPTDHTVSEIYRCKKCGFQETKLYPEGLQAADPMYCQFCNP